MKDVFKYTDFELLFDQKQSKFYSPEIMESDKLPFLEAASYLSIDKPVYADAAYRYVYGEAGLGIDEQYLVKISMYQWVVQPETKTIAGYKCTKATYSRPGAEGVTHTAWFCPEIKSRFGPIGMGNLPGTILQVEQGGMVFTTTKVELKVKEKIEFPKNVKIITEEEYLNLWDEWERKEMGAPQGN